MLKYSLVKFKLNTFNNLPEKFAISEMTMSGGSSFVSEILRDFKSIEITRFKGLSRNEIADFVFIIPVDGTYTKSLTFRFHIESGCGRVMSQDKTNAVIFRISSNLIFEVFVFQNKYGASMMLLQDLKEGKLDEIYTAIGGQLSNA